MERIVANFEIAAWGVVEVAASRVHPCHSIVRRDCCIRFVEISVDLRITRDSNRGRAVREVVGVLGADDVDF